MLVLLLPAAITTWTWALVRGSSPERDLPEALLKSLLLCWAACVAMTEALSAFHALTRAGLIVGWIMVILAATLIPRSETPRAPSPKIRLNVLDGLYLMAIAAILGIAGFTAWVSAPNSADAMAYHLPRVVYWAQARSVAFFPTPYLNQIMLQPFAEYAMLHTYLLSGGDHFVNLIQFTGFAGSVVATTMIAKALGLNRRAQLVSGLVCATLPNGILQASGAKNDCVLALWLAAMAYFAARRQIVFVGVAVGLALGTKATAYLFAPPLLVGVWLASGGSRRVKPAAIATVAAAVLVLNGPQYARNFQLSGSILGFDSAQGDGFFRWRNENLGWRSSASNILRNLSEQLGARGQNWNQGVYDFVVKAHRAMGIDPQDPADTWPFSRYGPPRNANHEADGNNRWHLLLAAAAMVLAAVMAARAAKPRRNPQWLLYSAGVAGGFLAFCFYLKWQPFSARLELPLFVLAAPLIAWPLRGYIVPQTAVCLFLLSAARHPLFDNWTRPLRGPSSVLAEPRDLQYFNDMTQWNNRDAYFAAADRITATGCGLVGIDITLNQLEYPLQALLRERNREVRFVHVNVTNASRRYVLPNDPPPCTIFQLR